ncbi:DNA ligase D [Acidovorax sp.]|uniref:DNA ligase D n=1 Tax=Acidovorax sp. TaxID=1872122 RepID=UPI002ACD8FA6|nr:DNA ligase D [Acidovorax sp.]MDZ7864137.1 DNA ligase D [Acidovorax sp.]
MADSLALYQQKRNFAITPEPAEGGAPGAGALQYVIQKHWASRLHYDLRLELDGTMKSWAVPKGPSLDPADKRMAVQVEDHPISYNSFEGQIPPKQYGAGKVIVWDRGYWVPVGDAAEGYRKGKLKFELHGHKLKGHWTLVRMHGKGGEKQPPWLLIKEHDDFERPAAEFSVVEEMPDSVTSLAPLAPPGPAGIARAEAAPARPAKMAKVPLPDTLAPQLATLVDKPPADTTDWLWELKFDGYRLLARVHKRSVRLFTRNGNDWTHRMPQLVEAIGRLPLQSGWLDGEVVAVDEHGTPDFQMLQNAFDASVAKDLVYYVFDLPYADGNDLRSLPVVERRERLRTVLQGAKTDSVRLSEGFEARPSDLVSSACHLGFEGVIGKRKSAPYVSRRNADWIKLKCGQRQEFVVCGYTDPQGSRTGIGSLLLGVHGDDGALRYAGNVGSGFSERTLQELHTRLTALATAKSPFPEGTATAKKAHWVKPRLIAEVSFAEWTKEGRIRHSVFHGLRADKPARAIVQEKPQAMQAIDNQKNPARKAGAAKASEALLPDALRISHPDRVIDPSTGITKIELVRYYATVAPLMVEHLKGRPVSLVRAPDGVGGELFFQKHLDKGRMEGVNLLDPALDAGHAPLLEVAKPEGLLSAAQMNVVEFHTWNARKDRIERPDRMTFDLDPGEGVPWEQVLEAAQLVQVMLQELHLPAFLKTSGGKGLHVVVPLKRLQGWDAVKGFSQAVVQHLADTIPARFVAKSGPRNRVGKIFVDYLRNGRGATTVSAWSARSREGMGISVPVAWKELGTLTSGAHWTVRTVGERLRQGNAPWEGYAAAAASLSGAMRLLGYAPKD